MNAKKVIFILFAILAIGVGLYPLVSMALGLHFGILDGKSEAVLVDVFWNISFYIHIGFGGIALLIGWTGFIKKLRVGYIGIHKAIGKMYIISALFSALAGCYMSLFANGGWIPSAGFISLALIWFYTSLNAYLFARAKDFIEHEKMMTYSYAACFAAVTLRIWNPLLIFAFNDPVLAYKIVAWWSWVPNLFVAYLLIRRRDNLAAFKKLKSRAVKLKTNEL